MRWADPARARGGEAAADGDSGRDDVALVCMPYVSVAKPSLALGLIKAILGERGIGARVHPANLWFMEEVGLTRYRLCAHLVPLEWMAGEWTFARAAFRDAAPDAGLLLGHVRRHPGLVLRYGKSPQEQDRLEQDLLALREAAGPFVDGVAARVLEGRPAIVGCTSSFEQHVPSLALLRRVKELEPGVVTVLGGANCEGPMGEATHRLFPWVDYLVSGEADGLVGPLFEAILEAGRDLSPEDLPPGVRGPAHREAGTDGVGRAIFHDLDALPYPDYREYFEALEASPLRSRIHPGLLVESSRGCWWGARHPCRFCGLNGTGMTYRSKSPQRAVREIRVLQERHGIDRVEMVDNVLDMGYLGTMLPELARDGRPRRVFYEVKAGLSRDQVLGLVRHGVTWVQPGIESLHSEALRLMDKGVRAWQNVQLLKWAREAGLRLSWALLWGFPGEEDAWYDEMAALVPRLEHLQPPNGLIHLRVDRFSAYHQRPEAFGLALRPVEGVGWAYPCPDHDLEALAYFFREEGRPRRQEVEQARPGVQALRRVVERWRASFWGKLPRILSMQDDGECVTIIDTRTCHRELRSEVRGLARTVLLACDEAPPAHRLAGAVRRETGRDVDAESLSSALDELRERNLVVEIDGRLVTLAVRGDTPHLPGYAAFPGGYVDYGEKGAASGAVPGVIDFAGVAW